MVLIRYFLVQYVYIFHDTYTEYCLWKLYGHIFPSTIVRDYR